MKRAQLFFERSKSIRGCLEEDNNLTCRLDFFFPMINGVDGWEEVRARRQSFRNQRFRDAIGCLHIRKSADGQKSLSRRSRGILWWHYFTLSSPDFSIPFRSAQRDGQKRFGKSNRHQGPRPHRKRLLLALESPPVAVHAGEYEHTHFQAASA